MRLSPAYSGVLFNPRQLRACCDDLVQVLPGIMERTKADTIAVMGKSGMGMLFALMAYEPDLGYATMVVRKQGENTHGRSVEGTSDHRPRRYLVLDDFVCTGNTLGNIERQVYAANSSVDDVPELVGCLQYQYGPQGNRDTKVSYSFNRKPTFAERYPDDWSDNQPPIEPAADTLVVHRTVPLFFNLRDHRG